MNLWISLTNWQGVGSPEWTGLDNYRRLLEDEAFWASFRHNAALIVAMAIVPDRARAAPGRGAVRLRRQEVRHRHGGGAARLLLPAAGPADRGGRRRLGLDPQPDQRRPERARWRRSGSGSLAQDWLGDPAWPCSRVMVIMVWVQLGFPVVIFMAGLQRVDPALYEAAELDGASWMRRFWHVTLPQIKPEIYVVLLWTTIAALKVFGPIYVLTRGGPGGATNVPAYFSYQNFFERTQVGYGAAIATVLTAADRGA